MKPRLPRKLKKEVNRKVRALNAGRMAMCAVVVAQSAIQYGSISAHAVPNPLRVLKVLEIAANNAQAISNIMSEKPNHWKDFIR